MAIVKKVFGWGCDKLTSIDLFHKNISFTYKGKDSFKTLWGGAFSFVIISVMAVYACSLLNVLVSKTEIDSKLSSYYQNSEELENHQISEHGMNLSIVWFSPDFEIFNESYGTIEMYQVDHFIGSIPDTRSASKIPLKDWSFKSDQLIDRRSIYALCPKYTNFTIQGNEQSYKRK